MWIKRGIALALCAVVIGLCCVQVLKVDTGMQYLILSPTEPAQDPEKPTPTELSKLIDKLKAAAADWSGIISCWALSSQNETVSLSGKNAQNTSARLVGVYGNQAALPGQLARFGRTFYEEELAHGDKVILLSEALAIALFRAGDPVDRIVTIGETEYRVIGILRGGRTPGDHDEYTAWVPLLALDQAQFQTTTLTVSARSLPGAGAASQFKTDMNAWHAGGDLYLLSKERQRALLPARLLAAVMGFAVMLRLMTLYRRWAASLYRDYRRRLESQFAVQLLPRLLGMWTHLERQEGAIGTRGPGETQLESDRRHIRRKISKLESELKEVRRVRATQRERRIKNEVPVVAIVGYTNAGKSTLLNKLTGADIPANNRLFDTLDTTTRTLEISDTCTVLLSDTVGFIRKLPHHLVEAFKATLEELEFADLLLHVIDSSNPQWREQAAVVDQLIHELGADQTPRIEVFNKCDLWTGDIRPHGEDRVSISAWTGEGLPELLSAIGKRLDNGARRVTIHLPYDRGGEVERLYQEAKVEKVDYGETIDVVAVCTPRTIGRLGPLVEGWKPHKEPWED